MRAAPSRHCPAGAAEVLLLKRSILSILAPPDVRNEEKFLPKAVRKSLEGLHSTVDPFLLRSVSSQLPLGRRTILCRLPTVLMMCCWNPELVL